MEDVVQDYERKIDDDNALYEQGIEGVKASYEGKLVDKVAYVPTAHNELMEELASITTTYEEKKMEVQRLHGEVKALYVVDEEKLVAELAKCANVYILNNLQKMLSIYKLTSTRSALRSYQMLLMPPT